MNLTESKLLYTVDTTITAVYDFADVGTLNQGFSLFRKDRPQTIKWTEAMKKIKTILKLKTMNSED